MDLERKIRPTSLFFFFSITGIILFFIVAFFKGPHLLEWITMENNPRWVMSDHFRHVVYSQYHENVYNSGNEAYFPPLAYMFYYFVYRITCDAPVVDVLLDEVPQLPYQMIIFIAYTVLSVILLVRAVDGLSVERWKKNLLLLCIVLSVPAFAGGIERGNMTVCAVAFLLMAFNWKDSEEPWKREGALLLIAVSAGLKVYPAVFGLLYIREKRWKEAFRLVIYGVLFFFVPFLFFGGIAAIGQYLKILSEAMGNSYYGRVQFFKGVLSFFGIVGGAADAANLLFMLVLLAGLLFSTKEIRRMSYVAAFMAFVPGNAYRYTLLYFLLSVFVLFREEGQVRRTVDDYVDGILLGLLFSIPTVFGILTDFRLNYEIFTYTYVERYIYTVAWFFLFYQFLGDLRDLIRKRYAGRFRRRAG